MGRGPPRPRPRSAIRFPRLSNQDHPDLFAKAINEAQAELDRLSRAQAEARAKVAALRRALPDGSSTVTERRDFADLHSPLPEAAAAKVHLFRESFRGRADVFPRRWENAKSGKSGYSPACANEWIRGVCGKPKTRCSECTNKAFLPVDDQVVLAHLNGEHTIGVYPLLPDDTCWFVAADFDEVSWHEDVLAFAETARCMRLPVAIERSRSGNGAHVWFFFTEPVAASHARRMASFILTETMSQRRELSMRSYDRLFPSQDTLPKGGFGNLIALPFQRTPRQSGNSLFLDDKLEPLDWQGQWHLLASVPRLTAQAVIDLAEEATRTNCVLGVGLPAGGDDARVQSSMRAPSPEQTPSRLAVALPSEVPAVLGAQILFDQAGLPSVLVSHLKRLAAFQNPEFYKRERLRLSTARVPLVICCADDLVSQLALPRGCRADAEALLAANHSRLVVQDLRQPGSPVPHKFVGELTGPQQKAATAMLGQDSGVLVAPPGMGRRRSRGAARNNMVAIATGEAR
jgi:hypothetical protein